MGAVYRGRWGGRGGGGGGGMLLDYIYDARTDTVTAKQCTNKIKNKTICKPKLAKDKGDDTSIMESFAHNKSRHTKCNESPNPNLTAGGSS